MQGHTHEQLGKSENITSKQQKTPEETTPENITKEGSDYEKANRLREEIEKSGKLIEEILKLQKDKNIFIEKEKQIRKALYFWRHCALSQCEYNPQDISEEIKNLYAPVIVALRKMSASVSEPNYDLMSAAIEKSRENISVLNMKKETSNNLESYLVKIKENAAALKITSGSVEVWKNLVSSIKLLKGEKSSEVCQVLHDLIAHLNTKLDSDYTTENKIALKKEIENYILSNPALGKAYLALIQAEYVNKTKREVLGTTEEMKVGNHLYFMLRLVKIPGNEALRATFLESKSEEKELGEYGLALKKALSPVSSEEVKRTLKELETDLGNEDKFIKLERQILSWGGDFTEKSRKETVVQLFQCIAELHQQIADSYLFDDEEIALRQKLENLISQDNNLAKLYVKEVIEKNATVKDSDPIKAYLGSKANDEAYVTEHFDFAFKLVEKFKDEEHSLYQRLKATHPSALGEYSKKLRERINRLEQAPVNENANKNTNVSSYKG